MRFISSGWATSSGRVDAIAPMIHRERSLVIDILCQSRAILCCRCLMDVQFMTDETAGDISSSDGIESFNLNDKNNTNCDWE
jgi:hypothetical protein